MIDTKNIDIRAINLQAAIACNLKCEYCMVQRNASSLNLKDLTYETNEALLSGKYLENVKKILNRLNQSYDKIRVLEIWGQEPTLMIQYLTPVIKNWYDTFYNLEEITFSTNGMDKNIPENLYNFIIELDKSCVKPLKLNIQISYDGVGEEIARNGNRQILIDNFTALFRKLNNIKLNNLKCGFFIHAVMSKTLMDYINNDFKKIEEYFNDVNDFLKILNMEAISDSIFLGPYTLQYMNGSYASIEDGLQWVETCNRMQRFLFANQNKFPYLKEFCENLDFGANTLGCVVHRLPKRIRDRGCKNLDEYVDKFLDGDPHIMQNIFSEYCGTLQSNLRIMYDGTSINCQNFIFDAYDSQNKKTINYNDTVYDQARKYAVEQKVHMLNLITATDEEINKILHWANEVNNKNNTLAAMNMIANNIFMMAQIGQVDRNYLHNFNKIKNHAFLIAVIECCYFNLLVATGSTILHPISQIRYFCNGLLDKAEETINQVVNTKGDIPDGYV